MRRVLVAESYADANNGRWAWEGSFHQWGQAADKDGASLMGIVEKDTGEIVTVEADRLKFAAPLSRRERVTNHVTEFKFDASIHDIVAFRGPKEGEWVEWGGLVRQVQPGRGIFNNGIWPIVKPRFDFRRLQALRDAWAEKQKLGGPPHQPLLGVVEELGELAHSHLKEEQGIRMDEDHVAKAKDAIGDITLFLASYCSARGWDFQDVVQAAWEVVARRDYGKANNGDGERQDRVA